MVELTLLNGLSVVLNGDLIERIEARPDTIVSLTTGRKLLVRESVAEVVHRLFNYRRALYGSAPVAEILDKEKIACALPQAV